MKPLVETYRPRRLADIVGQPAAVKALALKLKARQSFAAIFAGEPGTGKTSAAYAVAGELGVDTGDPCSGWRLVPSNRQGVEELEALFTGFHCRPLAGDWWVIALEESECKSKQAANYLKTRLESLPARTVVIFTTNAQLDEFTAPAVQERCLCLEFEHDASALWEDASKLVAKVWETELGHNHAPSLEDLGFSKRGRLSFRQVIKAVEPLILAELLAEPETILKTITGGDGKPVVECVGASEDRTATVAEPLLEPELIPAEPVNELVTVTRYRRNMFDGADNVTITVAGGQEFEISNEEFDAMGGMFAVRNGTMTVNINEIGAVKL